MNNKQILLMLLATASVGQLSAMRGYFSGKSNSAPKSETVKLDINNTNGKATSKGLDNVSGRRTLAERAQNAYENAGTHLAEVTGYKSQANPEGWTFTGSKKPQAEEFITLAEGQEAPTPLFQDSAFLQENGPIKNQNKFTPKVKVKSSDIFTAQAIQATKPNQVKNFEAIPEKNINAVDENGNSVLIQVDKNGNRLTTVTDYANHSQSVYTPTIRQRIKDAAEQANQRSPKLDNSGRLIGVRDNKTYSNLGVRTLDSALNAVEATGQAAYNAPGKISRGMSNAMKATPRNEALVPTIKTNINSKGTGTITKTYNNGDREIINVKEGQQVGEAQVINASWSNLGSRTATAVYHAPGRVGIRIPSSVKNLPNNLFGRKAAVVEAAKDSGVKAEDITPEIRKMANEAAASGEQPANLYQRVMSLFRSSKANNEVVAEAPAQGNRSYFDFKNPFSRKANQANEAQAEVTPLNTGEAEILV